MELDKLQSIIKDVQDTLHSDQLGQSAINRPLQAVEALDLGEDENTLVPLFSDEQVEALRQAEFYDAHSRFYHENVAANLRAEADVFGALITALTV